MYALLEDERRYCRAIVHVCNECNKRADVRYYSWCNVHEGTNYHCGKHDTQFYRARLAIEMCYGCLAIRRRKSLKHPPGFRNKHPNKRRKQKKSRALAPFDRDKKKRRKYKGPKKLGEKRKKS
ncbi:hypothetical protein BTUL_0083g00150 [Botrytis tulipae]|uniref:Uncharacterized protein n=1 Tax=Botrytis tulipae TaxID=87230 RepID=A0A4Z1EPM2_9HELO|nr:hypothetical protein BTUL_0083g00150 [Botrytis tulipae]